MGGKEGADKERSGKDRGRKKTRNKIRDFN